MRPQNRFLEEFENSLIKNLKGYDPAKSLRSLKKENRVGFKEPEKKLRRDGKIGLLETFEIGDLRFQINNIEIIVEYDHDKIVLSNLIKFWPYVCGELGIQIIPPAKVVFCHFSDWRSYAAYRDLWEWTSGKMMADRKCKTQFTAMQFDHCGNSMVEGGNGITDCIKWIKKQIR